MQRREVITLAKIIRNTPMSTTARDTLVTSITVEMMEINPLFQRKLFRSLALPNEKEK